MKTKGKLLIMLILLASLISVASVPAAAYSAYSLYAGQTNYVGYVKVWNDTTTLYVEYVVTADCSNLAETHLAVNTSLTGIPQTKKGNPIPGQFPYSEEHSPGVRTYRYEIPLSDIGSPSKGTIVFIAAHAVVYNSCTLGDETAWGSKCETPGMHPFPGSNWATYFLYRIGD